VPARTFHAAALRQLHFFWPQAVGGAAPEVLASKAPVVAESVSRLRMQFDRTAIRDLAAEIEWGKVSLLTPQSYAAGARRAGREAPGIDHTAMARVWESYEERKTERGVIDFEDVLLLMAGILDERMDIARTVRDQYRHFVVDEYQDVNALQQRLLDLWLGGRDELCVVGDPPRRSTPSREPPGAPVDLPRPLPAGSARAAVRNYRSTPQILGLANLVVRSARPSLRRPGVGGSAAARALPDHVDLQAQGEPGPQPRLTAYPDDPAEAAGVAGAIKALVDGGRPPGEIAVLFRTNAQSEGLESALAALDVPYLVRGGERFFARQEVRGAIVLLRGAVRGDDGSRPLPELVRDVLTGGVGRDPPTSGERSASAESHGPGRAADDPWQPAPARMGDLVSSTSGPRRSTPPPSPVTLGCPARGQGPGVGHRLHCRLLRRLPAHRHGRG
jgi:DNA helicase-2/ATP-dependent DNA helicase PcrA